MLSTQEVRPLYYICFETQRAIKFAQNYYRILNKDDVQIWEGVGRDRGDARTNEIRMVLRREQSST